MKNNTPNLQLLNPSTGEFDWDMAWWKNTEILDLFPGVRTVSSAELPAEPWTGQLVFLWDKSTLLVWNGERWLDLTSGAFLKLEAGEEIEKGQLTALSEEGTVVLAGEETPTIRILGVAVTAADTGDKVLLKSRGKIRLPEFQLEAGKLYYPGSDGGLATGHQGDGEPVGIALAIDVLLLKL